MHFNSSSKSFLIPIDNCSSDCNFFLPTLSSHNSLKTWTTRISFFNRFFRTAFILPWSVQLCFFPTRATNCCIVSLSPGAPGNQRRQKNLSHSSHSHSLRPRRRYLPQVTSVCQSHGIRLSMHKGPHNPMSWTKLTLLHNFYWQCYDTIGSYLRAGL